MIRAYIQETYMGFSEINVLIVDHGDGETPLTMRVDEHGHTRWEQIEAGLDPKATLTLPHDTGRVLLDALTRHYQGAEDTRQLRQDYNAERARVDKLTSTLGDVVRTLAVNTGQR